MFLLLPLLTILTCCRVILQSYSAVYCGDQHRSYHGTTVQLVQPHPSHLVVCSNPSNLTPHTITELLQSQLPDSVSQQLPATTVHVSPPSTVHQSLSTVHQSLSAVCQLPTSSQYFHQQQVSPDGLPNKLCEVGPKRQRIVTVNKLKSSADNSTTVQNLHTRILSITLTLNDFLQSAYQISERNTLQ